MTNVHKSGIKIDELAAAIRTLGKATIEKTGEVMDDLKKKVEQAIGGRNLVIRLQDSASVAPEDAADDIVRAVGIHDEIHHKPKMTELMTMECLCDALVCIDGGEVSGPHKARDIINTYRAALERIAELEKLLIETQESLHKTVILLSGEAEDDE